MIPDPPLPPAATHQLVDSFPEQSVILSTRCAVLPNVKLREVGRFAGLVSIRGVTRKRFAMDRVRVVQMIRMNQMVRPLSLSLFLLIVDVADGNGQVGTGCGDGLTCASGVCTSRDLQCRNAGASIGITGACPTSTVRSLSLSSSIRS